MGEVFDGYDMSNRIVVTLNTIIKNDSDLQDFTIVSTETNIKNKSPVLYENHSLGLESWCIKPVYQFVCDLLLSKKRKLYEHKIPYNEMENLNCLLNGALLINPDVTTFWNMKRVLIETDITTLENELQFNKIVLTYKSKSNEAFSYRRWLLKKMLAKISLNKLQLPVNILPNELAVVHIASEKSQNNYYSWNHRIWCMESIASLCTNMGNIVYNELSYTQEWINSHVSEHAGYHYRQYLITLLKEHKKIHMVYESYYNCVINRLDVFKEDKYSNLLVYLIGKHNKKRILEESCTYINYICLLLYDILILFDDIFKHFNQHQSLYYHRRFLIYYLLKVPFDYHGIQYPKKNGIVRNINLWDENVIIFNNTVNIPNNFGINLFKTINNSYVLVDIITNLEKNFIANRKDYLTLEYQKWLKNVMAFE